MAAPWLSAAPAKFDPVGEPKRREPPPRRPVPSPPGASDDDMTAAGDDEKDNGERPAAPRLWLVLWIGEVSKTELRDALAPPPPTRPLARSEKAWSIRPSDVRIWSITPPTELVAATVADAGRRAAAAGAAAADDEDDDMSADGGR